MLFSTGNRLDDLVNAGLAESGDRIAVRGDGQALTGNDVLAASERLAMELRTAGVAPGDAVLVAVDNRPSDIANQLAVWACGGVAVPVHRAAPAAVLEATARRAGARLVVGPSPAGWRHAAADTCGAVGELAVPPSGHRPAELDAGQALVIFTSGSTGRPKGVVISHRALAAKLANNDTVFDFAPGEAMMQVLHLHFSFGQWTSLLTLASGGRLDLARRYSTEAVLERLSSHVYARIAVVPTMMRMMEASLTQPQRKSVLDRLRRIGSPRLWIAGGEPLPARLGRIFRELLPDSAVTDVFGLSESATSDFIVPPARYDDEAGTIGRPAIGVEARVMAETASRFEEAPTGQPGELWLRTPYLMTGYLDDPSATSAALVGEWLRTGDLAIRRPGGLHELIGRATQLIVRGGIKISPLEIENVFSAYPDCSNVVAVGLPDDVLGERMHLVVTARAGRHVDPVEVRRWGRTQIEPAKLPDRVHVVDELPVGVTGKTDRAATRAYLSSLLDSAS